MKVSADEWQRVTALMREFNLQEAEDLLRARASPIFLVTLAELRERNKRTPLQELVVGASRSGGPPDLPPGFSWPHFAPDNPLHFYLQLDLASLPAPPDSLFPGAGMLYVFFGMTGEDYAIRFQIHYSDEPRASLQRTMRPGSAAADQLSAEYFAAEFEPHPLQVTLGTEIPWSLDGRETVLDLLSTRLQPEDQSEFTDRILEFSLRCADADHASRDRSGYPRHWWQVATFLGATNEKQAKASALRHLQASGREADAAAEKQERGRWQQFLQLDSNTITGFDSLCDARPYRLLLRAPAMPWCVFEHVDAHMGMD